MLVGDRRPPVRADRDRRGRDGPVGVDRPDVRRRAGEVGAGGDLEAAVRRVHVGDEAAALRRRRPRRCRVPRRPPRRAWSRRATRADRRGRRRAGRRSPRSGSSRARCRPDRPRPRGFRPIPGASIVRISQPVWPLVHDSRQEPLGGGGGPVVREDHAAVRGRRRARVPSWRSETNGVKRRERAARVAAEEQLRAGRAVVGRPRDRDHPRPVWARRQRGGGVRVAHRASRRDPEDDPDGRGGAGGIGAVIDLYADAARGRDERPAVAADRQADVDAAAVGRDGRRAAGAVVAVGDAQPHPGGDVRQDRQPVATDADRGAGPERREPFRRSPARPCCRRRPRSARSGPPCPTGTRSARARRGRTRSRSTP